MSQLIISDKTKASFTIIKDLQLKFYLLLI